ncbi:MAG TPA: Ig-like domain repeat protein [Acidimicrobiales bacterium]
MRGGTALAVVGGMAVVPIAVVLDAAPAGAVTTIYTPATPSLATLTSPSGCSGTACAPWNEYQGDPGSSGVTDNGGTSYPESMLLPTYVPGGPTTTTSNGTFVSGSSGPQNSVTAPNLSVVPASGSGTDGVAAYPSGVVGTPGPLDGYCGSGTTTTESAGTVARQPAGTTLPFAPSYFPHIVRNSDGSLTGYFDYRPKDGDEALMAATSTDNGKDWTYNGEALEQDPGYCPSADTNDDGQGHSNVITVNGTTFLYTLPRAAGDMQGVGMVVHQFSPTESSPLNGLPATEPTGIDPDGFATSAVTISSAAQNLSLTTTGSAGSTEQLVTGGFVDLTQDPNPTTGQVINCTVTTGSNTMTGCTSPGTVNVAVGDLIEQVIGYVSAQTGTTTAKLTIPLGPNTTNADGGLGTIDVSPSATTSAATSGSSNLGFTLSLTGSTYNANAPDRVYFDSASGGTTAYCSQGNNNPTTKIEDCTTPEGSSSFLLAAGDLVLSDPIIPRTAYESDTASGGMTSGLVAPDGIVGTLPSFPNDGTVPSGATYVVYTEKELSYYLAGDSTNALTMSSTVGQTLDFIASPYISQNMPSPSSVTSSNPVTVEMGLTTTATGSTGAVVPVSCTSLTEAGASSTLGGCTIPSTDTADTFEQAKTYVAAPGATNVALATLAQTGEGSATNVVKLYKNNEDLSVLRVAYTTNGYTFSNAGLTNNGIISDCVESSDSLGTPQTGCTAPSNYTGINNPSANTSPSNLNQYATNEGTPGSSNGTDIGGTAGGDADELRWVGSAGSIITNPNGTFGMFLSGSWAADGDSDAFNQIFYSESSDGLNWSVPVPVISTDYSFSASYNQDNNVSATGGTNQPLGISAYYEGRAYGASVVQNPNGTLTMLFAGYRFPKSISSAGTVLGTGAQQWTVGANDLTAYRNILTTTLSETTSPAVATTTAISATPTSTTFGNSVTFTATVAPSGTGSGTPTGVVTFSGSGGPLCSSVALNEGSTDQASCTFTYSSPTTDTVSASYSGDSNYAASSSSSGATVTVAQATPTTPTILNLPSSGTFGGGFTAMITTNGDGTTSVSSTTTGVCTTSGLTVSYVGVGTCTLTAQVGDGTDYTAASGTPQSFTVNQADSNAPTISNLPSSGTFGGGFTAMVATDGDGSTSVTSSTSGVCMASGLSVTLVGVGSCVLTAHVANGTNFGPSDGEPQSFMVGPADWPVTVTGSQSFGGSPTFTVSPSSGPTQPYGGSVTCTTVNNGTALSPTLAPNGAYTLDSANCSGLSLIGSDATDDSLVLTGSTFTVSQGIPTAPTISNLPSNGVFGSGFTANVSTDGDGTTSVASSTSTVCTASGSSVNYVGVGTCTLTPEVTAGTDYSAASGSNQSITVDQAMTTVNVTALPGTPVAGQSTTVTATIDVTAPGAGQPTGTVAFTQGGSAIPGCATQPVSTTAGVTSATCAVTASTGTEVLDATYSGDSNFSGNLGSITLTAGKGSTLTVITANANPTPYGAPVTFTATVTPDVGTETPTGTVTFTLADPAPLKGPGHLAALACQGGDVQSLAAGAATCVVTSGLVTAQSPATATASYAGDSNFSASTASTFTETVGKGSTQVVISSNHAPQVSAKSVAFTAFVTAASPSTGFPSGAATWTITGQGSDTVACTTDNDTLNKKTGKVTCHVAAHTLMAADSPYTVSVTYGGDANFASGTGTFSQVMSPVNSRVKVSGPTSTLQAAAVSYAATVTAMPAAADTPTGTVTFSFTPTGSGTAPTCTGGDTQTLSAAGATCSIPGGFLAIGSPYTLSVSYSGDTNDNPSTLTTPKSVKVKAPKV